MSPVGGKNVALEVPLPSELGCRWKMGGRDDRKREAARAILSRTHGLSTCPPSHHHRIISPRNTSLSNMALPNLRRIFR